MANSMMFSKVTDAFVFGTYLSKVVFVVGFIFLIIHSGDVGVTPRGMTINDAIPLVIVVFYFSLLMLVIGALLFSIGVIVSPVISVCLSLARKFNKVETVRFKLVPFSPWHILPALLGVIFIYKFYTLNHEVVWTLPLMPIIIYLSVSGILYYKEQLAETERGRESFSLNKKAYDMKGLKNMKDGVMVLSFLTAFAFLFLSGVSKPILERSFELAGVKVKSATVYIKEPYGEVLSELGVLGELLPGGIKKYDGVDILVRGVGRVSIFRVIDRDNMVQLVEIPEEFYTLKLVANGDKKNMK